MTPPLLLRSPHWPTCTCRSLRLSACPALAAHARTCICWDQYQVHPGINCNQTRARPERAFPHWRGSHPFAVTAPSCRYRDTSPACARRCAPSGPRRRRAGGAARGPGCALVLLLLPLPLLLRLRVRARRRRRLNAQLRKRGIQLLQLLRLFLLPGERARHEAARPAQAARCAGSSCGL
jgi:hypothetical protein